MAVSSKDIETLWQRYTVEAVPAQPTDTIVIKYINLGLSNGMKIEHHNLSYGCSPDITQRVYDVMVIEIADC